MPDPRDFHVALPRERKWYASVEATYGTRIQPAGADAARVLNAVTGSPQPARIERVDNRQTRSIESKITGSTPPIEWSAEGYLIPSGAAGTAPDWGDILAAALGPATVVGGTSVTYNPSDVQAELGSLTITDHSSDILMQSLAGGWVEDLTIRGGGGDPVMILASGLASSSVLTGRAEITSVVIATVTPVAPAIRHVEVGSKVFFLMADGVTVRDNNAGAGFTVISKTATTYDVNVNPTGVIAGDHAAPFTPTEVTAGNPATGIVGSLTLDSIVLNLQSWELAIKNNIQPHADEAFQANATGYHEDNRQVTGQVVARAHADQVRFLSQRKEFAGLALSIVVGATAGSILTIAATTAELGFATVDQSQPESAIITLPFQALGTGNEVSLAFT